MEKTAMIVAMSCGLLYSLSSSALTCTPGNVSVTKERAETGPDQQLVATVYRLDGKTVAGATKLQADYVLQYSFLTLLRANDPIAKLQVREVFASEGSVCIAFNRYYLGKSPVLSADHMTSEDGGDPVICVDQDGDVASKLKVKAGVDTTLGLTVRAPRRDSSDIDLIINGRSGACRS